MLGAASGTGPAIAAAAGSIDVREATLTPCRNVLRFIFDVIVRSNHRLRKNSNTIDYATDADFTAGRVIHASLSLPR